VAETTSSIGRADGSIIAAVIVIQSPTNQSGDPSPPSIGPSSWRTTTHAPSETAATAVAARAATTTAKYPPARSAMHACGTRPRIHA
jgi:hypothetical protein